MHFLKIFYREIEFYTKWKKKTYSNIKNVSRTDYFFYSKKKTALIGRLYPQTKATKNINSN